MDGGKGTLWEDLGLVGTYSVVEFAISTGFDR